MAHGYGHTQVKKEDTKELFVVVGIVVVVVHTPLDLLIFFFFQIKTWGNCREGGDHVVERAALVERCNITISSCAHGVVETNSQNTNQCKVSGGLLQHSAVEEFVDPSLGLALQRLSIINCTLVVLLHGVLQTELGGGLAESSTKLALTSLR